LGAALIPEQRLSSSVMDADFLPPDDLAYAALTSYEMGGTDLNDADEGLMVKVWTLTYVTPDVILTAPGAGPYTLFSYTGITSVSLAFDQNMRPCVAYVKSGVSWLYWYDSLAAGFTHTQLEAGILDPHVCMDDKRANQILANDIILAYTKDNNLYFRAQRDRFGVEYLLRSGVNATLKKVGMNRVNRLQFQLEAVT
jgi:hypothetical protein